MATINEECNATDTSHQRKTKYVPPFKRNAPPIPAAAASPPPSLRNQDSMHYRAGNKSQSSYNTNRSSGRIDSLGDRGVGGKSTTGTGWDTRNGRKYYKEDESEIFKDVDLSTPAGVNFDSFENIPVEVSGIGSEKIVPIPSFQETEGVHPIVQENIKKVNYKKPTPVQKYAIPSILLGRDVMACAQTGSGKTAAFLFPTITKMLSEGPPTMPPTKRYGNSAVYPVALILSPTRELAMQTHEESRKFSFNSGIRTVVMYGGTSISQQSRELEKGCDIAVATPGRLEDFVTRGKIQLRLIKYLVLDEADRMLDMGFEPKIREIVLRGDMMKSEEGRQTIMFSATFPPEIQELASSFLRNYIFVTVGRVGSTNHFIRQDIIYVAEDRKPKMLIEVLKECSDGLTLVFVETKRKADMVECYLQDENFQATSIHGDRDQNQRETALSDFKSGRCPVLVATDVAARGLDIPNIKRVINLDLPGNIDDYVHRIGRTGRAGNYGTATSFLNETNGNVIRELHDLLEESTQETPQWLKNMMHECSSGHFGRGNYGGKLNRRGGKNALSYGGRDIRHDQKMNFRDSGRRQDDSTVSYPARHTGMSNGRSRDYNPGAARVEDDKNTNDDGWE